MQMSASLHVSKEHVKHTNITNGYLMVTVHDIIIYIIYGTNIKSVLKFSQNKFFLFFNVKHSKSTHWSTVNYNIIQLLLNTILFKYFP